jgi:uncharacterized membrane protein (UPF0127 family)
LGGAIALMLGGCQGSDHDTLLAQTSPAPARSPTAVAAGKDQLGGGGLPQQGQQLPLSQQAILADGTVLALEHAITPEQQALGLMFRTELPPQQGMLFSFRPARRVSFWMKNVAIPLDMVFLRDRAIVAIAADVLPCAAEPCPTYGPAEPVDMVIELSGGQAARLGLQVGDTVRVEPRQ